LILSIVIPCYNSEKTLRKCLDSFWELAAEEAEVLIVNDGSTDGTLQIANEYAQKSAIFTVIDKPNGGHGSVINFAANIAKGKYIKVVDSDDFVINLSQYVNLLKNFVEEESADVILTDFRTIDSRNLVERDYCANNLVSKIYNFDELWRQSKADILPILNIHGITYRTEYYKSQNIQLTERISYEDREYETLLFLGNPKVFVANLLFYCYSLGNPWQSVADENQVKNLPHMEIVLDSLIKQTPKNLDETNLDIYNYFIYKQSEVLISIFTAAIIKNPNKKAGRKYSQKLYRRIKTESPKITQIAKKRYFATLLCYYLKIDSTKILKLQKLKLYRYFAKIIKS